MRFFFVPAAPPALTGPWQPPAELQRHWKALRLQPDEDFLLLLPLGGALRARWNGRDRAELFGLAEPPRLALLPVTLASAWPKGARGDDLVVHATELGVERIIPLRCERSVGGEDWSVARQQRYERLARAACEQCGRPLSPSIDPRPLPLAEVLAEAPLAHPVALMPEAWPLFKELELHVPREVLLLVGPEGGFSPAERAWFRSQGVHEAGIAPTILRIEVAGPHAVGLCQHWRLDHLGR